MIPNMDNIAKYNKKYDDIFPNQKFSNKLLSNEYFRKIK